MLYLNPRIEAFPECVHERCEADDVPYRPPTVVLLDPHSPSVRNRVLVFGTTGSKALGVCSTPYLLTQASARPPENEVVLKIIFKSLCAYVTLSLSLISHHSWLKQQCQAS